MKNYKTCKETGNCDPYTWKKKTVHRNCLLGAPDTELGTQKVQNDSYNYVQKIKRKTYFRRKESLTALIFQI